MAKKEPSPQHKHKEVKETREVIGYPEQPMPMKYIVAAAAAWGLWIVFLLVMAYVRYIEWPFYPT
jgi:hypothetical protein